MDLNPEQRTVLELAAGGLINDEVAACLGIGRDEVRRHLVSAMEALKAGSKLEAVIVALRLGLIDPPGDWPRSR